ncbi:MAG: helix-turn-helix transcriptional regulator [Lachnospiraceae bacterium]|nr:helix-turn-helix transcriptional regulator [Lachnospiraceae bacterium]
MQNSFLPQKLRQLRKANGYTQDYIAAALGVVRQTYSHYETGKRTPDSSTLYKLAGIYNIPIEDLMHLVIQLDKDENYDMPVPTQSSKDIDAYLTYLTNPDIKRKYKFLSSFEKELLYYFEQISEPDKLEIIDFVKYKVHKNNH